MTWFLAVLLVLLMGGIALVAAGRGEPMTEEHDDRPDLAVPAEADGVRLSADDLRRVRFPLAFRGYRMDDVDALLDRLARERETDTAPAPVPADDEDEADEPSRPAD
ncbi:MAG: DivIVA domain-containing protein [Nocardioides sp.]|nr:DivIVA domain-containing protein [Nocardioides sp.]